jgi:hypothetical protein
MHAQVGRLVTANSDKHVLLQIQSLTQFLALPLEYKSAAANKDNGNFSGWPCLLYNILRQFSELGQMTMFYSCSETLI